jgi:UDP-sugar transporter A1/2/3
MESDRTAIIVKDKLDSEEKIGDNKMKSTISPEMAKKLKYISLLTLTGQNAVLGLSMRYSRTREGDMFYEGTAVLMAEMVKLVTCLYLVFRDVQYDFKVFKDTLYQTVWVDKIDTLKVIT